MKRLSFISMVCLVTIQLHGQYFQEVSSELSLEVSYGNCLLAAGVTFADLDGDGFDDMLIPSCSGEPIRLFRNTGQGFEEWNIPALQQDTASSKTILIADFDNDGDKDIFVGNILAPNKLYRNDGNLQFTEISQSAGLNQLAFDTFAAAFADINNDGWLDLYVTNRPPTAADVQSNFLYLNNGDGTFTDITTAAGVGDPFGAALAVSFFDYNNDGHADMYVANDRFTGNRMFRNNGNLTFSDVTFQTGTTAEINAMSVTVGDWNDSGHWDFYVTNTAEGNLFFENNGDGTFTERAVELGVQVNKATWGSLFFDFDNDGDLDLFVPAMMSPIGNDNDFFENQEGIFVNLTEELVGLDGLPGMGAAVGDLDNDGQQDFVVLNAGGNQLLLYRNPGNDNRWIRISLQGTVSNRDAVGSIIEVWANGKPHKRILHCGSDFASQSTMRPIIGTGSHCPDSVVVRFPSGIVQTMSAPPCNEDLLIVEDETLSVSAISARVPGILLFPNPVRDEFTLVTDSDLPIFIMDISGRIIRQITESKSGETKVDFSSPDPGIYLVKQGTTTLKFVKE